MHVDSSEFLSEHKIKAYVTIKLDHQFSDLELTYCIGNPVLDTMERFRRLMAERLNCDEEQIHIYSNGKQIEL